MANTYELIKEFNVGKTGITDIVLSGIPQTYKDLQLQVSARSDGTNGTISVYFNEDFTNANYFVRRQSYTSSYTTTGTFSAPYFMYGNTASYTQPHFGASNLYISDYASTSVYKIVSGEAQMNGSASANAQGYYSGGYWASNAAVNKITLRYTLDPQFLYNTTVRLYGISTS